MALRQKFNKMHEYESLVRNFVCESEGYEDRLIAVVTEAFDFSLQNLRVINDAYKNYEMYWFEVCNSALFGALGALLDKEGKLRKSQKLALFFKGLIFQEKYRSNRMDFIFILQIMKRKSDIADVAADKDIWRADGFTQFGLVEAIYKLKIPGFSSEFLQMKKIAQIDADKQMQRYVDKYLEKEKSRLEGTK